MMSRVWSLSLLLYLKSFVYLMAMWLQFGKKIQNTFQIQNPLICEQATSTLASKWNCSRLRHHNWKPQPRNRQQGVYIFLHTEFFSLMTHDIWICWAWFGHKEYNNNVAVLVSSFLRPKVMLWPWRCLEFVLSLLLYLKSLVYLMAMWLQFWKKIQNTSQIMTCATENKPKVHLRLRKCILISQFCKIHIMCEL